jgi:hypothetical protein
MREAFNSPGVERPRPVKVAALSANVDMGCTWMTSALGQHGSEILSSLRSSREAFLGLVWTPLQTTDGAQTPPPILWLEISQ